MKKLLTLTLSAFLAFGCIGCGASDSAMLTA